jgi:hypothetical protein|tara:strand:- start:305 stop:418 length:114 start_codon:yes stop_codon:yes gene_type:complete
MVVVRRYRLEEIQHISRFAVAQSESDRAIGGDFGFDW